MKDDNIILSIVCVTYNHEEYLRFALDGILMQQTNFNFEVLVGEDCSTDNSKTILKDYENRFPDKFHIFYRENNYGAKRNIEDLCSRVCGKYICILETDDFWIDPFKLQKQIDFLENNPEYFEVSHRCVIVDKNNEAIGLSYPETHKKEYSLKEYQKGLLPGQTTSRVFRNFYTRPTELNVQLIVGEKYARGPGDRRKAFSYASQTKVACLPYVMSAYRLVTDSGDSYNAKIKCLTDDSYRIDSLRIIVDFSHDYNLSKKAIYVAEYMYFREKLCSILRKKLSVPIHNLLSDLKSFRFPVKVLISSIYYIILALIKKPFHLNDIYKKSNIAIDNQILKTYKKIRDEYYESHMS